MQGVWWLALLAGCSFTIPAGQASIDAPIDGGPTGDGPPDAFALVCPAGYVQLGPTPTPSVYRVVGLGPSAGTWVTAETDCRDDGTRTHLAIAETAAEHQLFEDVVSGASRWLGVTDRKIEGTWRPIIGGTDGWFTDWYGGAQPATNTNYNCLMLSGPLFEEAMPCNDPSSQWHKGFICECDGKAVDLTTF